MRNRYMVQISRQKNSFFIYERKNLRWLKKESLDCSKQKFYEQLVVGFKRQFPKFWIKDEIIEESWTPFKFEHDYGV